MWNTLPFKVFSDELFSDNSYIISYKLKNGMVVMRHYSDRSDLFSESFVTAFAGKCRAYRNNG